MTAGRRTGAIAAALRARLLPALPFALLAIAHAGALGTDRAVVGGLLVTEDLLVAWLLLTRRGARHVSHLVSDVTVTLAAVVLPLALYAPGGLRGAVPPALECGGVLLALAATASLGRDMGILPALRGVTTRGVYRLVRHPMYAAHLLIGSAYLLGAPSWRNGTIALATALLLLLRLRAEEAVLGRDPRYRRYCTRVPWRLVPGCY